MRVKVRKEDKLRIIELHRSGRSIASLTREFGVCRSTIKRALNDEYEIELGARCAEMLARGVGFYEVADYRHGVQRRELTTDSDDQEANHQR